MKVVYCFRLNFNVFKLVFYPTQPLYVVLEMEKNETEI